MYTDASGGNATPRLCPFIAGQYHHSLSPASATWGYILLFFSLCSAKTPSTNNKSSHLLIPTVPTHLCSPALLTVTRGFIDILDCPALLSFIKPESLTERDFRHIDIQCTPLQRLELLNFYSFNCSFCRTFETIQNE